MVRLDVTSELEGMKTTEAVLHYYPRLSAYNLKKMLRQGDIRLNGARIKKDFETAEGDMIEIYLPEELKEVPQLDISYEDRNIIVVNKQPGLAVNEPEAPRTVLTLIRDHMEDADEYIEELGCIPFALDYLDTYTGGLTLVAKNGDAFDYLREASRQRRIRHIYQAIVCGCPQNDTGEFQHFYFKEGQKIRVLKHKPQGAVPMFTRYRVLRSNGEYTLLELEPVTDIVDQVRIQLEAAGYPVIGDPLYGNARENKRLGVRYQALWSTEIAFATGVNNILEYLNGKCVRTNDIMFPLVNIG